MTVSVTLPRYKGMDDGSAYITLRIHASLFSGLVGQACNLHLLVSPAFHQWIAAHLLKDHQNKLVRQRQEW